MKDFTIIKLDLPKVPKKIRNLCLAQAKTQQASVQDRTKQLAKTKFIIPLSKAKQIEIQKNYVGRKLKTKKGIITTLHMPRYPITGEALSWLKENIAKKWIDCTVSTSTLSKHSDTLGPHVGLTRAFALIYLFKLGGKVNTNFYQCKGEPFYYGLGRVPPTDYEKLILTDSHNLSLENWYLINEGVLHDVQGIKSKRIALQISFGKILPKNLVKEIKKIRNKI